MQRIVNAASLAVFAAALLSAPLSGLTWAAKARTAWKVTGELEEACSCGGPCLYWSREQPSRMTCDGVQIIFITKGRFGKTPLDGLSVAQFVQNRNSLFESIGNRSFDRVYIDQNANEAQREALKELAGRFFPPSAQAREFSHVPITRRVEGREHILTVGDVGACSGHLLERSYSGTPKVGNPPLADPAHKQFLRGVATKLTYSDAGQGWQHENSSYMWNKFQATDREYAKFEAELARKMAEIKRAGM